MYRQQTIVMDIDKGKVFEEKKDNELFFTSTDFDDKIAEYIQTLIESGINPKMILVGVHATNDNLIAFIQYDDSKQNDTGLLKAVPDIQVPGQ